MAVQHYWPRSCLYRGALQEINADTKQVNKGQTDRGWKQKNLGFGVFQILEHLE